MPDSLPELKKKRLPYNGALRAFQRAEDAREAGRFFQQVAKAQTEGANQAGGFLVPSDIADAVIALRERVGVARQNMRVLPMAGDTITVARRTAGLTANLVAESGTITDTSSTFDAIGFVAKKAAAMVKVTTELEDDAVAVGDFLTAELAFALANLEDTIAWSGDGTSTHFGMRGLTKVLVTGQAGTVNAASGHDTFAEIDAVDLGTLFAKLPSYALANAKWYCSHVAYALVFCRLASGNGGIGMTADGIPTFWGLPVIRSNLLPTSTGSLVNLPMLWVGDMASAGTIASKRELHVTRSPARYFEQDLAAYKATERFDFVWHGLGDASTVGSLVALIGA
jgi:HK97 family phage major capsid protein